MRRLPGRPTGSGSTQARSASIASWPRPTAIAATPTSIRLRCRPASGPQTSLCSRRDRPPIRFPSRAAPAKPRRQARSRCREANDHEPALPAHIAPPALDHGGADPRHAVHRCCDGVLARELPPAGRDPRTGRHPDPGARRPSAGEQAHLSAAALAGRHARSPPRRRGGIALAALCPDVRPAARGLGHALGGGLSPRPARRVSPAADRAARRGALCIAAAVAHGAGVRAVRDLSSSLRRCAHARPGLSRRRVQEHDALRAGPGLAAQRRTHEGDATMNRSAPILVAGAVSIAVLVTGVSISAQDKYSVKVPGGLAFAEFRGYEDWAVIAISANGGKIAVIVGNPAMIDAYKAGVPANGKPFPDGARMAKVHWNLKKQETYPGQPTVPGTQHDVDFMVKDSKRFADSGGWGWAAFDYDPASNTFRPSNEASTPPQGHDAKCGFVCHTVVKNRDYVFRSTERGDYSRQAPHS